MQFCWNFFIKTSEQMSYALNENELTVNLRTGYDVRRVFIHYGDPFGIGNPWRKREMDRKERGNLF